MTPTAPDNGIQYHLDAAATWIETAEAVYDTDTDNDQESIAMLTQAQAAAQIAAAHSARAQALMAHAGEQRLERVRQSRQDRDDILRGKHPAKRSA